MADPVKKFCSYFPDDFKEYKDKELNWLPSSIFTKYLSKYFYGGVFWSREDDEPQHLSALPNGDISDLNKIMKDLLYKIMHHWAASPILVQFWAPITTKEGRSFLTTRNQPFCLTSFYDRLRIEGLCGYRMISMDSKFDIGLGEGDTSEQRIGLPARVFKHRFPESTPNVEFYSITEYPQLGDAVRCGCGESLAFPVFKSSTQRCVGVIEVVTPMRIPGFIICHSYSWYKIYEEFEKLGLKCSVVFKHKDMKLDDDKNEARKVAFDEIQNVLKSVCDVHDVPLAQAWVPCKMGWPCRALVDGGILHASCFYKKDDYGEDEDDYGEDEDAFHHISSLFHLKNGVGVVGRALLSTTMVFCRDVTQLSLTEYPLAHYARKARLSGCFAICLESNCAGNDVYVLEFFMPMSNNASENPHTSLRKILETLRKNFHCLRVSSREELGEELHVEEISIQNGEKLDPVQIPQTTISLPQMELSQSEVEVMQVDSSDQQLVNAINTRSNVGGTEHHNFAITCTQEKSTVKVSKRKGNKSRGAVKTSKRDGTETVYPMYKAFIEPDLQTAHIKIINKFNPFTGFQSPIYILKSSKKVTVDEIKAVMSEEHTETMEQTYDIYLLPPGEDPESCQSYLRMRNKDGKYNLMFEEWVTDSPFVISPRITFEVSVRLLGGLMALGYTIAAILKRSSHVFSDERVCVKIDWLEQLNRHYVQVQGKDRLLVKYVAEQLELEGSYVPRTYIEQIQLEKLVDEVMALPDDLKTKLSMDDDLVVASPKEALSRAAERVAMRNKNLRSGLSHSYSTQRDKNLSKITGFSANNQRFDDRTTESQAALANQGVITQLSEQISTLNDRMDEFTSRIEELNSKLTSKRVSGSQQNMALHAEACNGSAPTSYFISGLGNGSLTGSIMPNSSSSSQLAKESPLMEEISTIARGQRQILHQMDNLSSLFGETLREKPRHQARTDRKSIIADIEPIRASLILTLAVGGLGIFLFKSFLPRN